LTGFFQADYHLSMPGTLYLVATPIGNLEDITLRALRVLGEVDLIACEDTRHTRKLLSHYNVSKPLVSYHEHNERERAGELIERLLAGSSVALVSDAGMPLISDPGYCIVSEAARLQVPVVPIPGPSALIAALAASGLPTAEFVFAGFLPPRRAARKRRLEDFLLTPSTLVFYEAPHRIRECIDDARQVLGDRQAALARELTKLHEEIIRGRLSELAAGFIGREPRGEYVLLIGPRLATEPPEETMGGEDKTILEQVDALMEAEGIDRKTALKRVAKQRGLTRREAYRQLVEQTADLETRNGEETALPTGAEQVEDKNWRSR
jgi:16S rRNA (cytidine1402-2'-O)-methyltransferase